MKKYYVTVTTVTRFGRYLAAENELVAAVKLGILLQQQPELQSVVEYRVETREVDDDEWES